MCGTVALAFTNIKIYFISRISCSGFKNEFGKLKTKKGTIKCSQGKVEKDQEVMPKINYEWKDNLKPEQL